MNDGRTVTSGPKNVVYQLSTLYQDTAIKLYNTYLIIGHPPPRVKFTLYKYQL